MQVLPREEIPMILNLLRSFVASTSTRRHRDRIRLSIELLEDRRLLSGFAVSAGGNLADAGKAVAADFRGNVHVAGQIEQRLDVTGAPNPSGAFVAMYSPIGAVMWMQHIGGDLSDDATAIAVDQQLNSYVAGTFTGQAKFDATHVLTPAPGDGVHGFIEKLDKNGHVVWVTDIESVNSAGGAALAVDGKGNVYTVGTFLGSATVAGHTIANPTGTIQQCSFLLKQDTTGSFQWAQVFGVPDSSGLPTDASMPHAIAVSSAGDIIYVAGAFTGSNVRFGTSVATPLTLSAKGSTDIFAEKFSATGAAVWAVRAGSSTASTAAASGNGITLDALGNANLTGSFEGTAEFGAQQLTAPVGGSNAFVSKLYRLNGHFNLTVDLGGAGTAAATAMSVDQADHIYVTGYFAQTAVFGAFQLTATGDDDVFVAELDSSLHPLCAVKEGGAGRDQALGIAADRFGLVDITGLFSQSGQFSNPPVTLTSAGDTDVFVSRMPLTVLSTFAGLIGSTLAISVDDGNHSIDIVAKGNGVVSVAFDKKAATTYEGVTAIMESTGDGNDNSSCSYSYTGATTVAPSFNILEGNGPEQLTIDAHNYAPQALGSDWIIAIHGGDGPSLQSFHFGDQMGIVNLTDTLGDGRNTVKMTLAPSEARAANDASLTADFICGTGVNKINALIGMPTSESLPCLLNTALTFSVSGAGGRTSVGVSYQNVEIDAAQAFECPADSSNFRMSFQDVLVSAGLSIATLSGGPTGASATIAYGGPYTQPVPRSGLFSLVNPGGSAAHDITVSYQFVAAGAAARTAPSWDGSSSFMVSPGSTLAIELEFNLLPYAI
jgi:hypothetical protein